MKGDLFPYEALPIPDSVARRGLITSAKYAQERASSSAALAVVLLPLDLDVSMAWQQIAAVDAAQARDLAALAQTPVD